MSVQNEKQPYKRSLIDSFNDWVEGLPLRAWVFYLILGLLLIAVQVVFLWLTGGMHAVEILLVAIFNGLAVPYLLASMHLLDNQAASAVNSMEHMLDMSGQEVDLFKYELTHMPFWQPLAAGLVLMVSTIVTPLVSAEPARYTALEGLPVFSIVYHIIDKISAFLFGVVIYHTFRQLSLVNATIKNHLQVNLFQLEPLHSFSKLTASTALGLLLFIYAWMLLNPELLANPVLLGYSAVLTFMAAAIFIWLLWGIHELMEAEKRAARYKIDLCMEAGFLKFNQRIDGGEFEAAEKYNGVINSLEIQRSRLLNIPTWPWKSETARLALTAIDLPLILMVIPYFALQALDR
jgi:hypothetical protein